jgi:precorrin-6B methylase 2
MTSFDPAVSAAAAHGVLAAGLRFAPLVYALTLFGSAFLLFALQPMFTKMVLPILGGAPAVWSVAMVFFQAALLAGYAYAHLLARTLPPPRAALVHLAFLGVAALTLPIGVSTGFGAPPTRGIELWLVLLFAASIGLPFVALSASAPLMQAWFSVSGHPRAKNPYVLYAASNLGSFAALLLYPFLIEPTITLRGQSHLWSLGFALLVLAIATAGLFVSRVIQVPEAAPAAAARPAVRERLVWAALAAIPSGLVIAVTAHITTDVAAAPFFWVVPLAFYLLTFVAVFRERPWVQHATVVKAVPFVVAVLSVSVMGGERSYWLATIMLNLLGFLTLTMLCHGELYQRRPAPVRLTEFYLWVSIGGVLGGIFAGLLAPNIFSSTYEYPILIAGALLALPGALDGGLRRFAYESGPPLTIALLAVVMRVSSGLSLPEALQPVLQGTLIVLVALMLLYRARPARLFGLVILALALSGFWQTGQSRVESMRSFFGVHKVVDTADGKHRLLFHGTTLHGAERLVDEAGAPLSGRPEPLTYFYFGGPISEAIVAARAAQGRLGRVAVVGLGTGSLACHMRAGERWTFFEIDGEVLRIARDSRRFRFLSECAPDLSVVLGDARLTLAAAKDRFDLIVLDAFSSDAIPVHLLTREALQGYLSRLNPRGMIVMHISNRHMELANVVAALAKAEGMAALVKLDDQANQTRIDYRANAMVAVLARDPRDFNGLSARSGWWQVDPGTIRPWTDDYSDVLGAILRQKLGAR